MKVSVDVHFVLPRKLAAVRCTVAPGEVASAWKPALDKVWNHIRTQPGLWSDGHNIVVYQHSNEPGGSILCEFGAEVTRAFETAGEVYSTATPSDEAAVAAV